VKYNREDITRTIAVNVFNWCKKKFGPSQLNGPYPKLVFHKKHKGYAGYYDPWKNEIHVFRDRHRTFMGFIGTVIHEYTHYRYHSVKKQYHKLNKIYSYKNHPMEQEAIKMEKKYKWVVYYELFSPTDLN